MSTTLPEPNTHNGSNIPTTQDPIRRACAIVENIANVRGLTYRYIAKIFSSPDQELLDLLQSGELVHELTRITAWLGDDQINLIRILNQLALLPGLSLAGLQSDYTCLFESGIERISPRESSYRWKNAGLITQSEADLCQVLKVQYNSVGVSCETGMEDHIAVELEFLAFLCEQEAQRWAGCFTEAGKNMRSQQRSFVDDHAACWIPEFCYRLRKKNRSIYGYSAAFCDQWMNLEHGSGYRTLIDSQ